MKRRVAIAVVLVIGIAGMAAAGYGIWYLFLQPPGPAAVTSPAPIPSRAAASLATADGEWDVDTTIGSFADFTNSWVGYRVQEQLGFNWGQHRRWSGPERDRIAHFAGQRARVGHCHGRPVHAAQRRPISATWPTCSPGHRNGHVPDCHIHLESNRST